MDRGDRVDEGKLKKTRSKEEKLKGKRRGRCLMRKKSLKKK